MGTPATSDAETVISSEEARRRRNHRRNIARRLRRAKHCHQLRQKKMGTGGLERTTSAPAEEQEVGALGLYHRLLLLHEHNLTRIQARHPRRSLLMSARPRGSGPEDVAEGTNTARRQCNRMS